MDFANFVKTAVALKGYQSDNGVINLTRSVRDIDGDTTRSYFTPYSVHHDSVKAICSPVETMKYDLEACSPSGNKCMRVSTADGNCIVEVLEDGCLTLRIDASDHHDKVIGDNWFGGYSFTRDERRVVYVAGVYELAVVRNSFYLCSCISILFLVPKKPKPTTFFDKPKSSDGNKKMHDVYIH